MDLISTSYTLVKKVDKKSISKATFSITFLVCNLFLKHKTIQYYDIRQCLHRTVFLLIESLQSWDIDSVEAFPFFFNKYWAEARTVSLQEDSDKWELSVLSDSTTHDL